MLIRFNQAHETTTHKYPAGCEVNIDPTAAGRFIEQGVAEQVVERAVNPPGPKSPPKKPKPN